MTLDPSLVYPRIWAGQPLPAGLEALLPAFRGLTDDSRQVLPGMAFAAYAGAAGDGRAYIADALARGATALLWQPADGLSADWPVAHLPVPGLPDLISRISGQVHGNPSLALQVIGVTGTNGKTSCTHWISQAFNALGRPCGLIGTLGSGLAGALQPTGFTTPGPVELQHQLALLRGAGARAVAMEVSSHALVQGRVRAVQFDLALFTNLTRDHLDYHGDMQAYGRAKATLFHAAGLRRAILNLDDAFGATLHAQLPQQGISVLGYTQQGPLAPSLPAISARQVQFTSEGTAFVLHAPQGEVALHSNLVGAFNLSNLLGVLACLLESDVPLSALPDVVAALAPPPGRLQRIGVVGGPQVLIDYAHTPDALTQVLRALRAGLNGGRLICMFGCGGDRDPGKRPQMGRVAEQHADVVILTSDNPRSEDPDMILKAIAAGMQSPPYAAVADRACAIALAVELARPGDIVLLAGKGHETTQEVAGVKLPFSDLTVARRVLGLSGVAA